jgi:hypothetical protein
LVGGVILSRHVLHERSSSTTIEEVDGNSRVATTVGGRHGTIEVSEKADGGAVDSAVVEDTVDNSHVSGLVCEKSVPFVQRSQIGNVQLPMTAVLTTRVKRAFWLAAVLFWDYQPSFQSFIQGARRRTVRRAVVYLSQMDMFWAATAPATAATVRAL